MLKNKQKLIIKLVTITILLISLISVIAIYKNQKENTTIETLSKYGSRGS